MTSATAPTPYAVDASPSVSTQPGWKALDSSSGTFWSSSAVSGSAQCSSDYVDGVPALYGGAQSTLVDGAAIRGAWVQLDVGAPQWVNQHSVSSRSDCCQQLAPYAFTVAASLDGVAWTALNAFAGQTWSVLSSETKTFFLPSPRSFRYFRFICQSIYNLNNPGVGFCCAISEWKLRRARRPGIECLPACCRARLFRCAMVAY